ncbi:hypothetical protein AGMMS49991_08460 [Spirochaetia bacterium]|nr:hypothetical protein AGMMS49991_08460 [Spirochaetia bacterium]
MGKEESLSYSDIFKLVILLGQKNNYSKADMVSKMKSICNELIKFKTDEFTKLINENKNNIRYLSQEDQDSIKRQFFRSIEDIQELCKMYINELPDPQVKPGQMWNKPHKSESKGNEELPARAADTSGGGKTDLAWIEDDKDRETITKLIDPDQGLIKPEAINKKFPVTDPAIVI